MTSLFRRHVAVRPGLSNAVVPAAAEVLVLYNGRYDMGFVRVYTGAPPATPATTATGAYCGSTRLTVPCFNAPTSPTTITTLNWSFIALAAVSSGTARYMRFFDQTEGNPVDLVITASGGGGDIIVDTMTWAVGTEVTLHLTATDTGSALAFSGTATTAFRTQPEAPRIFVTWAPLVTGPTVTLNSGESLNAAMDLHGANVTYELADGYNIASETVSVSERGAGYIRVKPQNLANVRMTSALAALRSSPRVVAPSGFPALNTFAAAATKYSFEGMEFTVAPSSYLQRGIVEIASDTLPAAISALPRRIQFDQCIVRGRSDANSRAAVSANAQEVHINRCDIGRDVYNVDATDCQGIRVLSGPAPMLVEDSLIIGSHEPMAQGGVWSFVPNLTADDIIFDRCHIYTPYSYKGTKTCKNKVEYKQGGRIVYKRSLIEFTFVSAQDGMAFLLWSVNQPGGPDSPWMQTRDVLIQDCWVKNCSGFANVSAHSNGTDSGPTLAMEATRIRFENIAVTGLRDPITFSVGGTPIIYSILLASPLTRLADVQFEHITLFQQGGSAAVFENGAMLDRLVVKNNMFRVPSTGYGIWLDGGLGLGNGQTGWDAVNTGSTWAYNGVADEIGGTTINQGSNNNVTVNSLAALRLADSSQAFNVNATLADLSGLAPTNASPCYQSASDGKDMGCDIVTLQAALSGVPSQDLPG